MSLIERIRKRQGLLIALLGFGMLGFLVPYDAVMALFGRGTNRTIGVVNGEEISALEYQNELQLRRQLGFEGAQLAEEVWSDMTTDVLLKDDLDELGLQVSDEEYQELIFGDAYSPYLSRAFFSDPQAKSFWQQNFQTMLGTPEGQANYLAYRKLISSKRVREKHESLIVGGMFANSLEAKHDYLAGARTVDFDYVVKPYASIPDEEVEVSDADVKAYFNAHKADPEYRQREGRDITFIRIPVQATEADAAGYRADLDSVKSRWAAASSDSLFVTNLTGTPMAPVKFTADEVATDANEATFFTSSVGTLVGPYVKNQELRLARVLGFSTQADSAKCRHILLKANDVNDGAEMAVLQARADSIRKALAKGAKFEDMVTRYSDDPGSKATGGFYDFFPRGRMVPEFENFAFDNSAGKVGVVKTSYGLHIVEAMGTTPPVRRVEVAFISRQLTPSQETARAAYSAASEFAIEITDKDAFIEAASTAGYPTNIATDITREATSISGLQTAGEVISWAFSAEEGEISTPILADNSYIVAYLDRKKQKGEPKFEHVEEIMRAEAVKEAKAEKYKELMVGDNLSAIATSVQGAVATASAISLKFPSIPQAGAGAEPEVVGHALGMAPGTVSPAIAGEVGVWAISTTKVNEAAEKTDFTNEKLNLLSRARGGAYARISNAMLEAADLEDLRSVEE
jgi:peptidyl-prolyl cis-trans isomerase D